MSDAKVTLNVQGMSCSHCENSVKKAVGELKGIKDVVVDLLGKTVAVDFDDALVAPKDIKEAIEDQGYDVE